MKYLNFASFGFLSVYILTSMSCALAQKVKSVKGMSVNDSDTIILLEKEYSKEGYLIYEGEPEIYVSHKYKYDEKGRLTESSQVFGESASNGGTSYSYSPNKECSYEGTAVYTHTICDSFDTDKKLIYSWSEFKGEGGWGTDRKTYSRYFYQNKLRIREEEIRIEYTDPTHGDTTKYITTYVYNKQDSLTERLTINTNTRDTVERLVRKYDPITNLRTAESQYVMGLGFWSVAFQYDTGKRLIKEINEENGKTEESDFYYNDGQLIKVIRTSKGEERLSKEEDIYENNLIQKTFNYVGGKKIESVRYHYTYW